MEAFLDLAQRCAPQVHVEILAAVASVESVESGLNPYAVRINSDHPLKAQPTTKAEAIEVAAALVSEGKDVDLGLGGVNVSDLRRLGLSLTEAFDSCRSLNATGHLLNGYYRAAMRSGASPAEAERLMLVSYYGGGDPEAGILVSFDKRVAAERQTLRPHLASLKVGPASGHPSRALPAREFTGAPQPTDTAAPTTSQPAASVRASTAAERSTAPSPAPARWDVFQAARQSSLLVFSQGDNP